ncbi:MAG: thiamine phosphate synthase [Planctomycetota bacterium]|jgi:thiamine-phosphate pyrophosphorylase
MSDDLYRILDANFNRCREAFRVMEEYCRFGLDEASLSGRAKQMRHRLCQTLSKLDPLKLVCSRDVAGDVGRTLKVDGQLSRTSVEDCFTAATKRASEALRALAEASAPIDATITPVMEQLRFEVYALEKDTLLAANVKQKFEPVRLYILINATQETSDEDVLGLTGACIEGGADCIQLRAKHLPDGRFMALAKQFVAQCKAGGCLSIINDRVDIAILSGGDGVHLGQDELSVDQARRLARVPLIVGVSTHNIDELQQAIESGCDYVGLGATFASPTKPQVEVAGTDYIKQAINMLRKTRIYHVAIGGIDITNVDQVLSAGTKAVAVSSAVTGSENPHNMCKLIKKALLANSK